MPFPLIQSLQLNGFLSFEPRSASIDLKPLNVLIGPNGSGKSNLIEAVELLRATAGDLAGTMRLGGAPSEWIWKGQANAEAEISATLSLTATKRPLRYRLAFTEVGQRLEIVDEAVEEITLRPGKKDVYFYYRFQRGQPVIKIRRLQADGDTGNDYVRRLKREHLDPQQSVLSQRKDPDLYPEVTAVGTSFAAIQTFREWSFGRLSALRLAQPADQSSTQLEPDGRNLGLILNEIEHSGDAWTRFTECLQRFLPRFQRLSTRIQAGSVQIYLHEEGLKSPVPATRLSDGTIRFIALLAMLLRADTASVICIEEPELGLHPDALNFIAELLVEASTKAQIIVTTHSDILVSALTDRADSVLVCEHLGTGTVMSRVDSRKLKFWLDKYALGEIWRIGELGGNL